jgi:hypothetical protein
MTLAHIKRTSWRQKNERQWHHVLNFKTRKALLKSFQVWISKFIIQSMPFTTSAVQHTAKQVSTAADYRRCKSMNITDRRFIHLDLLPFYVSMLVKLADHWTWFRQTATWNTMVASDLYANTTATYCRCRESMDTTNRRLIHSDPLPFYNINVLFKLDDHWAWSRQTAASNAATSFEWWILKFKLEMTSITLF